MPPLLPPLSDCTVVLCHGAGSSADFLARAFPPDRLGVAGCRYVDDRTGDTAAMAAALAAAAQGVSGPLLLGGVSLGGHAAAALLSSPAAPANAVGALLCMPAWLGEPDPVAAMTGAAAAQVRTHGIAHLLAELDGWDWVTRELREAWTDRHDGALAAELLTASTQPTPDAERLGGIRLPVGVVALADDPLHPAATAALWLQALPYGALSTLGRADPGTDLAVFADHGRLALAAAWQRYQSRSSSSISSS